MGKTSVVGPWTVWLGWGLGWVAAVSLALLPASLVVATLAKRQQDERARFRLCLVDSILRVLLFVVVYLGLLSLAGIVCVFCWKLAGWIFTAALPRIRGRGVLWVVAGGVGVLGLGLMLALYLVKSLFAFTSYRNPALAKSIRRWQTGLPAFVRIRPPRAAALRTSRRR